MSAPTFDALLEQVGKSYLEKKRKQLDLQSAHEELKNFGMAYLSLWAIVEYFAKRLGPICQRMELKRSLQEWQAFLNDESSVKPKKISLGKFDLALEVTTKIPDVSFLQMLIAIDVAPNFYELLDSEKRFRKRRNSIAHSGDAVSMQVYEEFKGKLLLAVSEIDVWLGKRAENSN